MLTFLAGAELDPEVFKRKWKEATAVGLAGFFFPFFGCAAGAYYVLGWGIMPSWLGGVALSTTSVAVVYAVMIEFGLNKTEYGKTVLAACFINDLGTVLALGFIFAPFTMKTLIFAGVAVVVFQSCHGSRRDSSASTATVRPNWKQNSCSFACLPWERGRLGRQRSGPARIYHRYGPCRHRGQGPRAHSPASDLTFGLLTPFYFIRAGSFVSIPALVAAPFAFVFMLVVKMATKFVGVYPVTRFYKLPNPEAMYTTLLMSTGLTFGTISSLYGLSHGIIDQSQYSILVAGVIGSAVIRPNRQRVLLATSFVAEVRRSGRNAFRTW